MRYIVYVSVGVFALFTRCAYSSKGVSWRQGRWNYERKIYTRLNYYRPGVCGGTRGCARGYVCRRRSVVQRSPVPSCQPDVRAAIRRRVDMLEDFFNTRNFKPIESLFTEDVLVLGAQTPISRGNAGLSEVIAQSVEVANWDVLRYKVDIVEAVTEDFVYTVLSFVVTSSVNDPPTFGKGTAIWRRTRGVYLIDNYTFNFDA